MLTMDTYVRFLVLQLHSYFHAESTILPASVLKIKVWPEGAEKSHVYMHFGGSERGSSMVRSIQHRASNNKRIVHLGR